MTTKINPDNDYPSINSDEIIKRLNRAKAAGEAALRATYVRDCPLCGCQMVQDGVLSTGLPLEHYAPDFGEVLKNHYMECDACGFEQAS